MSTKAARKSRKRIRRNRWNRRRRLARQDLLGRPFSAGPSRQALLGRAVETDGLNGAVIQQAPRGRKKLSQVILDFAQPFLDECPTDEAYRATIGLATAAWNLALLPEKEQEEAIEEAVDQFDQAAEGGEGVGRMVGHSRRELVDRKKAFYADDKRAVIDYELMADGGKCHLEVCYAL
jgi:hypothetical protein